MDLSHSFFSESVLKQSGILIAKSEREKSPTTPRRRRGRLRETAKICPQTALAEGVTGQFPFLRVPKTLLTNVEYPIGTAQKWLTLKGKNGRLHTFPLQTTLPKVQMTRHVPPMQLPRDVEVDRRRRQYSKVDLEEVLKEENLGDDQLMPTEEQYYLLSETACKHFLPLSFFDDTDFDAYSPDGWLALGVVDGTVHPIPAKAFVPNKQGLMSYAWQYAAVSDYNPNTRLWTLMVLVDECVYEVPKIQILFLAEDPHRFVQRLKKAVEARNMAENVLHIEAIIDSSIMQDLSEKEFHSSKCIEKLLKEYEMKSSPAFFRNIRIEVIVVFEHIMACYEFEKFVKVMPLEFPDFDGKLIRRMLPRAYLTNRSFRERQTIKSIGLNMSALRYDVLKTTLYYTGGGIEAMGNVVVECQYIETLSIFVCQFSRPLPLNDFLQSQQQNSSNVASYLKNFWPVKISSGICLVLRALGKGWLDITLDKWPVYNMCKISRFILQVKFRMQDSMQVLLEKSIRNFTALLSEPCMQFLELDKNYKWKAAEFIETAFPAKKPVFSMVIGISAERKVIYSTPPEDFEPALLDIFKKALEKTNGVRRIDAETLSNLRFAPNLYILTVELIEDMYVVCNDLLQRCYSQACIPLNAYARLYERFIAFYLLNVAEFMKEYMASDKSSIQVKRDILEHKRQKQELREILPAYITIGPFYINVDTLKTFLINKHIEIVRRLFEYYVQRMYDINEKLLEDCLAVYNKINERPQSIEHLFEIREFSVIVPDRVEELKNDIQIMWLEYEMLDSFFYNLSDTQFRMKWDVYAWPHKIMVRLSTLREEQKNDIEDFKRVHMSEIVAFEERLESLNEEIQAFSLKFDTERVIETAVDVKKTWRQIQELQKVGDVLTHRQRLFELEELSLEFLESIIEGFTPYREMWNACSDFLKLEEATTGNPLVNVELADVWRSMETIRDTLERAKEVFVEKEEVQNVAIVYLEKLDEFLPIYHCIEWLKNENWLYLHWQELCSLSGMDIKYSAAMNFNYLLKKGVGEHMELVHQISEKATNEAESLRLAMEEEERRKEAERQSLLMRKAMRKARTDIL